MSNLSNIYSVDLEVTGVSRSGRVRKKSSKLTDFQSPDEIEAARAVKRATHHRPHKMSHLHTATNDLSLMPSALETDLDIDDISDDAPLQPLLSVLNVQSINSDDEPTQDDHDGFDALVIDTTVKKSAYMTEKNARKKMRKDKGKSRYTAYILWSKEARRQMMKAHPELDFSAVSRRLSEMWANVPSAEKFTWRRRAKKMASKIEKAAKAKEKHADAKVANSKFLNRNSSTRKKSDKKSTTTPSGTATTSRSKDNAKNGTTTNDRAGVYKVTGTGPIDAAAHLKLLGDSLSVIGQRLKEHEVRGKWPFRFHSYIKYLIVLCVIVFRDK